MKTPPFLISASLLFWGLQTKLFLIAIPIVLAIESAKIINLRWDFSYLELKRISDICTIIFIGTLVWHIFSARSTHLIYLVIECLPVSFFPLILAQCYSSKNELDIRAMSLILRKQEKERTPLYMNLTYPYFSLCVLSATAANNRTNILYITIFLLSCFALFSIRPKRYSILLWILILIFGGLIGYIGSIGLNRFQLFLEQKSLEWFYDTENTDADPYQNITAIGEIGTLKQSDKILFRVEAKDEDIPLLLREASYTIYKFSRWFSKNDNFINLFPEGNIIKWDLLSFKGSGKKIKISSLIKNGKGILKLPLGVFKIDGLSDLKISKNSLGTVKVEEVPGLIKYDVWFNPEISNDSPPDKNDLFIPEQEKAVVHEIANKLSLNSIPTDEAMKRIRLFFLHNFSYSLNLNSKNENENSPIEFFLKKSKSGHCEYFATATVLLLRAGGIPARYSTGFMVTEFSVWENKFLVRKRDAHAWSIAYVNGVWVNFDTTPPIIESSKENNISQFMSDLWEWVVFSISNLRWQIAANKNKDFLKWLIFPLIIILIFRLYIPKKSKRTVSKEISSSFLPIYTGKDSCFYEIELLLNDLGYKRNNWETFSNWVHRINVPNLQEILKIHYRYRFDPIGISQEEKTKFHLLVKECKLNIFSYYKRL